jgi:hypothetical protein
VVFLLVGFAPVFEILIPSPTKERTCLADQEGVEGSEGGSYSPWKYAAQVPYLRAHQSGYKVSTVSSSLIGCVVVVLEGPLNECSVSSDF